MRQRTFVHFDQPVFSSMNALVKEIERDFSRSFESLDYYETEEAYLTSLDIPGVNFSDINIELQDEKLSISAERKNPFDKTGELTKKYGRTFSLPKNIDVEKINAHYENGVLSLTLPKTADYKTRKKIAVQTGERPKSWTNFLGFGKNEAVTAN